jgi:hypothetical protein
VKGSVFEEPRIRDGGVQGLIAAVIEQAWADLTARLEPPGCRSYSNTVTTREQTETRLFFTQRTGPWAESRASLCGQVGLDPDVLRAKAIEALEIHNARKERAHVEAADQHAA